MKIRIRHGINKLTTGALGEPVSGALELYPGSTQKNKENKPRPKNTSQQTTTTKTLHNKPQPNKHVWRVYVTL